MNKPKPPVFPESWYKHCPKVLEAKDWYSRLAPEETFEEADHAECAFRPAGAGLECENCRKFITRPFLNHKVDEEFLPLIEQFYRDMDQYEEDYAAWLQQQENPEEIPVEAVLSYEETNLILRGLEAAAIQSSPSGENKIRDLIAKIQQSEGYLKNAGLIPK